MGRESPTSAAPAKLIRANRGPTRSAADELQVTDDVPGGQTPALEAGRRPERGAGGPAGVRVAQRPGRRARRQHLLGVGLPVGGQPERPALAQPGRDQFGEVRGDQPALVVSRLGPGVREEEDANGRFDLETAIAYAHALEPYGLRWYEEAGDPLDYELQAKLAGQYQGPMATGENLFSVQDARNLIRYANMRSDRDVLQFDCALSYGLVEYMRILEMLTEHGWSARRCIPHGGHQLSLHIAAGLGLGGNESYPGIFQPFGGFADDTPILDSYVSMPDIPGIGFESKKELFRLLKTLSDS